MIELMSVLGVPLNTLAQVGTFALVLTAIIGAYVKLKDRGMSHAEVMCETLTSEVASLRKELHECEEKCRTDIRKLHEEIFGMRKQNIAEQISFISILLRSVDSPELQILLRSLENVQGSLREANILKEDGSVQGA